MTEFKMIKVLFMRQYRIVKDSYAGYELQHRSIWWPFWHQTGSVNTFSSAEKAEAYARSKGVVKSLGWLP